MNLPDWIDEFSEVRDYGYGVMIWLLAKVIHWPQFLLYFHSAVFVGSMFAFFARYSKNTLTPVFLLFGTGLFAFYMTAFRQSFGLSLALVAFMIFDAALKRKKGLFWKIPLSVLIFWISTTMHKSSYILVLALVILLIKRTWLKIVFSVIISVLVFIFRDVILLYGNEFVDRSYEEGTTSSLVGFAITLVVCLLPLIFLFLQGLQRKRKIPLLKDPMFVNFATLSLVGIAFYIIRLYALVFERVAFLFFIFCIPMYEPSIDDTFDKKSAQTLYVLANVFSIALFLYRLTHAPNGANFVFFWQ